LRRVCGQKQNNSRQPILYRIDQRRRGKAGTGKKTALDEAGITVRNKGKQERQIQTAQGVLELRRSVLKVQRDGTEDTVHRNREILPLDDYLPITGLPFKMSPEMMAKTAFFGVHESSFASAEQMMRKYLPARISGSLIREVTEYIRKGFYISWQTERPSIRA
jgi:hypothetical protein